MQKAEMINSYCRKENKGFIYASQLGFISFLFEDFGNNFIVFDKNGKKCKKVLELSKLLLLILLKTVKKRKNF